jgi:hypothetical protein
MGYFVVEHRRGIEALGMLAPNVCRSTSGKQPIQLFLGERAKKTCARALPRQLGSTHHLGKGVRVDQSLVMALGAFVIDKLPDDQPQMALADGNEVARAITSSTASR